MSRRNCKRKPPLEFKKTEELIADTEFPLDLSFKCAREFTGNCKQFSFLIDLQNRILLFKIKL